MCPVCCAWDHIGLKEVLHWAETSSCLTQLAITVTLPLGMASYMSSLQVSLARKQLYVLLQEVRKDTVPLADAFDYPNRILNSALGRYDGDVYTHLYKTDKSHVHVLWSAIM